VRCSRDEEEKAQRERGDEAKVGGCVKTALGRRGAGTEQVSGVCASRRIACQLLYAVWASDRGRAVTLY
jgi:hypothetical protein